MALTFAAIGPTYLDRDSVEEIDSDFYETDSEAEKKLRD